MSELNLKKRLLASSVFAGAALAAAAALPAYAQDADEDVIAVAEADGEEASVQQTIVVTGSLIPQSGNLVETSPVTSLGSADFDVRGVVRAEDMINSLPQAFGAQGSNLANGSTGTSSVNLRGLGASRTLTLLNGRRLPYGSLNTAAPDINFIPSAMVKKVDVLTGGASATYGSDAVAGVVNFVLDTEFEGLRIDSNYSFYQHDNSNSYIQDILSGFAADNPSQFTVPEGSTSDGETFDITAAVGGKFDNGRGHMSAFVSFQNTKEILQANRDYSQCALSTTNGGNDFTCAGSSTNQFANILDVASGYTIPGGVNPDAQTQTGWARVLDGQDAIGPRNFTSDTFNYNPYNHYQRPNERYSFGAFANYDVNEYMNVYTELMFMDNRTKSQIAPSGVFGYGIAGDAGGIRCSNPFLSAQQVDYLCGEIADGAIDRYTNEEGEYTDAMGNVLADQDDFVARFDGDPDQAALGPDGIADILLLRRNVEGGNRFNDIRHTTYRGVIGMQGTLGDSPWGYDVSMIYANNHRSEIYNNDLSIRKIGYALDAQLDGEGNIVCGINADEDPSNDDAACAPYDIFGANGPSDASVAYISQPLFRDGDVTQTVVTAKTYADLADYGIQSSMAEEGIKVAFGVEYRRDTLDSNPDSNFLSGDGAGQGGPTTGIEGSQEVYDYFAEINAPLIQGYEGIESLGVDLAYRRSNYDSVSSDAYKIGVEYAPVEDIRFRGSFQRAVRAANIFELFSAQSIGLFDLTQGSNGIYDPCAGAAPTATLAQCANTGVTPDQYRNIADNPAGQFNTLTGGNPDLEPETADTYTIGFVATPSAIPGLTVSLDYFDITVEDLVGTVPQELALDSCLETGDEFFCSLVNRGNGGTLWANSTGYIVATNINTGELSTSGFDLLASYALDLDSRGGIDFDYVGTLLESLETKPLPTSTGADIFDCVGYYGGSCASGGGTEVANGSSPEYRHKASMTWSDADGVFSVTGTWRYFAEVEIEGGDDGTINGTLDAQNYLDLSGSWNATDYMSLRLGVNNLTDEEPPLSSVVGTAPGNGNTYPQVYDAFGRYIFMGATFDF
ncbi:TonB-dependent receptor domain-containing protein [Hyphomonas sp. L-53-1-40]|uniref:TonB-dependent receptor domain-containing protein n=1 Tax=Hyphomonas sp. L-53-1-40 TaxID=1207058 RepID=UPI000A88CEF3|nr:TonB-dependent receptor [Hyphomonas sp. L-53-1-40]